MPPRPPRIAGVAAIDAAISGAARPIVAPQAAGRETGRIEQDVHRQQHDEQGEREAGLAPLGETPREPPSAWRTLRRISGRDAHSTCPNIAAITLS